jgi:hypothetical protein
MATKSVEGPADTDQVRVERQRIIYSQLDRVELLAPQATAAICDAIPAYTDHGEPLFSDVVDQVVRNYRANLAMLLEDKELTLEDISFVRGAAMRRARAGIALEDYLNAYRVGQQFLWESIMSSASETPVGRQAALSLATEIFTYTNFASTHAGRAYVEFQQYAVADADRERRDLLENLLAGELPARGPLLAAAHAYGIGTDSPMMLTTAVPVDPEIDPDALHGVSATMARSPLGVPGPLVVLRQAEIVALHVLGPGVDPMVLCQRLEDLQQRLRAEGVGLAIGISTTAFEVGELPRAYLEARAALELLTDEGGVAALPRMAPFDYLALRADDTAARLVDPAIRRFLEEDRSRGGVLIATIRALAEANLNMRAASERLFVHTNTAHYRLNRVEQRTGRNPRRIADLFELLVAIALDDSSAGRSRTVRDS